MPLPTPNEGEDEQKFISRCMANETIRADFDTQEQRSAVCFRQWRERGKAMSKAIDYNEEIQAIRSEWNRQHPSPSSSIDVESSGWVQSVRSDAVIIELGNKLFEITYTKDSEGVVAFALRAEWVEVRQEFVPAKGNALKAISSTDDELRVGNYIVLFGGLDLEGVGSPNINADGSKGEFFTAKTLLESTFTQSGAFHINWEHGNRELPPDEILGIVDWKTARWDEKGVFVERVLSRRSKYVRWVETLIDKGLIGTSSQDVSGSKQKAANGEITHWPLYRDTLTVMPMDTRMMKEFGENTVSALKALGVPMPTDTPEPEATPEAVQTAAVVAKANVELFMITSLLED